MEHNFIGMLRVKNEERWLERVLNSIVPLCSVIFVMDDHSTDQTRDIVQDTPKTILLRSPYEGLNEARDKNWLLRSICRSLPAHQLNRTSPHWVLCIDGDEELERIGPEIIRTYVGYEIVDAYSIRIIYLWDVPEMSRCDGVYGSFKRPSLYRLINSDFTFKTTPWGNGGNLHCSSIPQEFLSQAADLPTSLLHYGYLDKKDRLRKYQWYNFIDPGNEAEDFYRHMVQGDVPEVPAQSVLRWAGPFTTKLTDFMVEEARRISPI